MRKYISIFLLSVYALAVSGFVIKLHYCGGTLKSWSVNTDKVSCCCDDEELTEINNTDCCSDDEIKLQLEQDYNNIAFNFLDFQIAILPNIHSEYSFIPALTENDINVYNANAPPGLWQNLPLYKLHSSFTFYDKLA